MKKCPFCVEEIHEEATVCPHCQRVLNRSSVATESGEGIGIALLLLPFIGTLLMYFWVGQIPLYQVSSSYYMVILLVIGGTGLLAAIEASQLGFGTGSQKETGPVGYFFVHILFWIIGYPAYLYSRSKKGKKNYLIGGILVMLLFIGITYLIGSAHDQMVENIQSGYGR